MKKCVAVIEIASNELRLKIGERYKKNVKILENVTNPLALGRDTFHSGRISVESLEKTAETILSYKEAALAYGIKNITALATTAVRESRNRDFILDQLKVKTGIDLKVIDDTQEKIYINKMTLAHLDKDEMQSTLIAHLGSGNISIFVLRNGKVGGGLNIKIGSLRISELFDDYRENTANYVQVIKEYLYPFQEAISEFVPEKLKNFVISGNEIATISRMCGAKNKDGINMISRDDFMSLYKEMKNMTPEEIADKYDISLEKAEDILPAVIIYSRLVKFTSEKYIISPILTAGDAILYEQLFPDEAKKLSEKYDEFSVISARNIMTKFGFKPDYGEAVASAALAVFDKMKKHHGLGARERLMLRLAAMLEEIGKAVNIREHERLSYHIIRRLDIVGINEREKRVIAAVAYYHSDVMPYEDNGVYKKLSESDRVVVCKLSAILKLANSLYRSHNSKIEGLSISLKDSRLIITASTYKSLDLEKWSFDKNKQLFEDVYGLTPVLNKRSVM